MPLGRLKDLFKNRGAYDPNKENYFAQLLAQGSAPNTGMGAGGWGDIIASGAQQAVGAIGGHQQEQSRNALAEQLAQQQGQQEQDREYQLSKVLAGAGIDPGMTEGFMGAPKSLQEAMIARSAPQGPADRPTIAEGGINYYKDDGSRVIENPVQPEQQAVEPEIKVFNDQPYVIERGPDGEIGATPLQGVESPEPGAPKIYEYEGKPYTLQDGQMVQVPGVESTAPAPTEQEIEDKAKIGDVRGLAADWKKTVQPRRRYATPIRHHGVWLGSSEAGRHERGFLRSHRDLQQDSRPNERGQGVRVCTNRRGSVHHQSLDCEGREDPGRWRRRSAGGLGGVQPDGQGIPTGWTLLHREREGEIPEAGGLLQHPAGFDLRGVLGTVSASGAGGGLLEPV